MVQDTIKSKNIVVGLDVGTSKIAILVGELKNGGQLEIIGKVIAPSVGLKHGVVVNIESTTNAIKKALQTVELMIGFKITSVWVGIVGTHISSRDTQGLVRISNKEVAQTDVDRVLDSAQTIKVNDDKQVIHMIPQEYIIDSQPGITQPIGMAGVRLEVKVHMVTCAKSALQNLMKCVESCGLKVEALVLQPLASSMSVLIQDEKELGVVMVDIGSGTTDVAIYIDGSIRHTAIIPIAGDMVTKDIAYAYGTPHLEAEQIKLEHGCAHVELLGVEGEKSIKIHRVGRSAPREVSLDGLTKVIEDRYEDILERVKDIIAKSGYAEFINGGVVLTGGGSSIYGLVELTEEIFEMPVRIGEAREVSTVVSDTVIPSNSTGIGLLKYAVDQMGSHEEIVTVRPKKDNILNRTKTFLFKNF